MDGGDRAMGVEQRIVVESELQPWQDTSTAGVWIKYLSPTQGELGETTCLLKLQAGTALSAYQALLGAAVLVLWGEFSNSTGRYSTGSYCRNPSQFCQQLCTEQGCILLVKSDPFQVQEGEPLLINTTRKPWQAGVGDLQVMPLYQYLTQSSALLKWPAGTHFKKHSHFGCEEVFVISGEFIDEHGRYPAGTWIRNPHLSEHTPYVEQDTIILVNIG